MIRRLVRWLLPKSTMESIQRLRKQARNFKILASDYGQWRTIKNCDSVGGDGDPVPWYTYPATEYLSHLDLSEFKVFEYGSGNSTLWWAKRTHHITAVEDDEVWHKKISTRILNRFKNVSYVLEKDLIKYSSAATDGFDIYIVDGKARRECLEHLLSLRGGGVMLILDNSDWYPQSVKFLKDKLGWVQIDFHGFGPINNYTWTTTIFVNQARYADLFYSSPLKSIKGIVQEADDDF
jgi:hypothetical protein